MKKSRGIHCFERKPVKRLSDRKAPVSEPSPLGFMEEEAVPSLAQELLPQPADVKSLLPFALDLARARHQAAAEGLQFVASRQWENDDVAMNRSVKELNVGDARIRWIMFENKVPFAN
jgi:hypothetical protein